VEVFKYLGRLLAQDDNDIRVIRAQPRKARATWARVGQVLRAENVPPHVAGGVLQSVGTGRAALWQQNMGPFNDLFGKSSGVPHPCSLPNGGEAQAAEGPRTRVDLPEVKGCVGRVWDEHTRGVHHSSSANIHGVRGNPLGSNRMQAG
jgi:hypothetical protein